MSDAAAFEKHYMVTELAEKWGMDPTTLRRLFRNQPGVLKLVSKKRGCREYVSLRVPESVALRVHAKLSR